MQGQNEKIEHGKKEDIKIHLETLILDILHFKTDNLGVKEAKVEETVGDSPYTVWVFAWPMTFLQRLYKKTIQCAL